MLLREKIRLTHLHITPLRLSQKEREELTSPHHPITILLNERRTLAFVIIPELILGQSAYIRVQLKKDSGMALRKTTEFLAKMWLVTKLDNLYKYLEVGK